MRSLLVSAGIMNIRKKNKLPSNVDRDMVLNEAYAHRAWRLGLLFTDRSWRKLHQDPNLHFSERKICTEPWQDIQQTGRCNILEQ